MTLGKGSSRGRTAGVIGISLVAAIAFTGCASTNGTASKPAATNAVSTDCSSAGMPSTEAADYKAPADLDKSVIDAANKEGTIVLNSGLSDPDTVSAFVAAFNDAYPKIKVQVATGKSADLEAKFLAEDEAGNQHTDVEISNKPAWVEQALKLSAIESFDKTLPGIAKSWPKDWQWKTDNGMTVVFAYRAFGFAYNTDLTPKDLIPKDWADLEDPAWKDHIIGLDPNASVTYARQYQFLYDQLGEKGFAKVADNTIKSPLYADVQPASQALAAGGGWVNTEMGLNVYNALKAAGAPLAYVQTQDATGTQYVTTVATHAPHPNAAKVFAQWIYTPEGQWAMACGAQGGTVAFDTYNVKNFVPIFETPDLPAINAALGIQQ